MFVIKPYFHNIKFYETNSIGKTNRENFIIFMKEARIDLFQQSNLDVSIIKTKGYHFLTPRIECNYIKDVMYNSNIEINTTILELNNTSITYLYIMIVNKKIVFKGTSKHLITNSKGNIINIKHTFPKIYKKTLKISKVL